MAPHRAAPGASCSGAFEEGAVAARQPMFTRAHLIPSTERPKGSVHERFVPPQRHQNGSSQPEDAPITEHPL